MTENNIFGDSDEQTHDLIYSGTKMDFMVLSQKLAEQLYSEHPKPCILISIVSPEMPDADIKHPEMYKGILRLKFHDLEYPIKGYEKCKLFSKDDAIQILDFVNNYADEIKLIVVHCEAGVSRSAGVAAALSLILNYDCGYFHKYFHPNTLVKSTILRAAKFYSFEETGEE